MSESRERTDVEREAARRERELRRAGTSRSAHDRAGAERPAEPVRSIDGAELPPIRVTRAPPVNRSQRQQGRPVRSVGKARRAPEKGKGALIARRVAAVGVLVTALAVVWFLVELFQPFHGSGHGTVVVRVPHDASSSQVGDLLAHDGVISSAFLFDLRATLDGDRGKLFAGTYRMPLGTSYGNALMILTTPPAAAKVTNALIIPGLSRERVDALLRSQHVPGSYLADTRRSRLLDPTHYGAPRDTPTLEGFLFPDTYQVLAPLRIGELVDDQLETFKQQFATINMAYARSRHMTPYDVLIIASIVQGEAATRRDVSLVASVIYNRLARGMALGSDATTRYAAGNYTRPLTTSQINSPSPWNTRVHTGLPPTPINSPGMSAIEAAAHPPSTNYLYFIVKPCGNGALEYASNYRQFLVEDQAYETASAKRAGNSPEFCSAHHG
ncbi:MAG: endolytic transglycosylase MltG [Solirubrobacteraceae bacterium]